MLDEKTSYAPKRSMSLRMYRKTKLRMLERDFYITLTQEELEHANSLTSEIAIDQFCITIIKNHL